MLNGQAAFVVRGFEPWSLARGPAEQTEAHCVAAAFASACGRRGALTSRK